MKANNFRHQDYDLTPEAGHFELLSGSRPENGGAASVSGLSVLHQHQVAAIYLIHGTFTGDDILGLFRKVASLSPALAFKLSRLEKGALDTVLGDAGNYTAEFAAKLASQVNGMDEGRIPVKLFQWSGENSHVGRCDGAVRLLDELLGQAFPSGSRVMLWGHSHGGNVLALLTNLLGAVPAAREEFFHAAAHFYAPLFRARLPAWTRVRDALRDQGNPLANVSLDVVTFGAPIRYGWDVGAASQLLHFVNHRPAAGLPEYQASLPRSLDDVLNATFGDVIQQLGIAGTGISPGPWSLRSRLANRRLRRVLQKGIRRRDLLRRLTKGKRVADAGKTLLIDYDQTGEPPHKLVAGHAVYTRVQWQAFHLEQVLRRCYQEPSE